MNPVLGAVVSSPEPALPPGPATPATGPVVVLSYAYSGAALVQEALGAADELACTSGTGVLPLCGAAAETWRRVEGQDGAGMSRLATSTVRGMITAQVTAILARAGKSRWCELATASPAAAEPFRQVFPQAGFLCVHRQCLDVVLQGVQASPWGLHSQGLMPFLLAHPGNSVAALASSWVNSTEELLAFEQANSGVSYRVRYEDVVAEPDAALAPVRGALGLAVPRSATFAEQFEAAGPPAAPPAGVPLDLLPLPLRQRADRLHAELGYPPLGE